MIGLFSGSMETQCNSCGKVISKNNLAVHLKTHGYASFRCQICDKRFKTKNNLNQHVLTHQKPPDIKCPNCTIILHSKTSLRLHVQAQHEQIKYNCEFCKAELTQLSNLKKHQKKCIRRVQVQVSCPTCVPP